MSLQLLLAPIRGITDCLFRTLLQEHFGGFDGAIAPFINPQGYSKIADKHLADLLPESNQILPVIPQLLHTNTQDFIRTARRLYDMGYEQINWNLGCPAPMVTKKKRGSGLLPYPEEICHFLDQVCPAIPQQLSIKTRLGFSDKEEIFHLLPLLDGYPLQEIIIHSRLGVQLYRGEASPDSFARCCTLSKHELVYNGDINNIEIFKALQKRFPKIQRWMIGRGALKNPFLAKEIKDGSVEAVKRQQKLMKFHGEMYQVYQDRLDGPSHLLGRMKQFWAYFIHSFPGSEKQLKKIKKARTESKYLELVAELLDNQTYHPVPAQ